MCSRRGAFAATTAGHTAKSGATPSAGSSAWYGDGALQRSQAYRDLAAAEQDAERTLAGLKDFNHARLGTPTPPDNERAATTC